MRLPILCLPLLSFLISWLATLAIKRIAPRLNFVDKPGHRKIHYVPKPLGGGIAIFLGIALPLAVALLAPFVIAAPNPHLAPFWSGARQQLPLGVGVFLAMFAMHLLGLVDDRRAMGPFVKLIVQLSITAGLVLAMEFFARHTPSLRLRVLSALDHRFSAIPSIVITVLWIGTITNAFNFLDNMDGLSAGIAA